MDRITWLRKNDPANWNPDQKLQISIDSLPAKGILDAAKNVFDAEIIPNSQNIPAINPQDNEIIPNSQNIPAINPRDNEKH